MPTYSALNWKFLPTALIASVVTLFYGLLAGVLVNGYEVNTIYYIVWGVLVLSYLSIMNALTLSFTKQGQLNAVIHRNTLTRQLIEKKSDSLRMKLRSTTLPSSPKTFYQRYEWATAKATRLSLSSEQKRVLATLHTYNNTHVYGCGSMAIKQG